MSNRNRFLVMLAGSLALSVVSLATRAEPTAPTLDGFPKGELSIATSDARLHRFKIWIAATNPHREQGLMFVKTLPDDQGMLFIYPMSQYVSMWMKNTFLPLDMLFIRPDGKIARVVTDTQPHSLKVIDSGEPVLGVLELKAGIAKKLNIKPGAFVMHEVFNRRER